MKTLYPNKLMRVIPVTNLQTQALLMKTLMSHQLKMRTMKGILNMNLLILALLMKMRLKSPLVIKTKKKLQMTLMLTLRLTMTL